MPDYDVIVVGAGPAGSIAAYECTKYGLNTLLLEKCTLPREKPCGGAVMYRGVRIVKGDIPSHLIEQKIYGLRFALHNYDTFEFISDKLIGITVFREFFDEFLARRAVNAGTTLLENARVIDAFTSSTSAKVKLKDGSEFSGSFLIGADGVNSVVSRSLGLRPQRKDLSRHGLGMEADFHVGRDGVDKATDGNPHVLSILPVEGKLGYGWVFPKKEHLAIGIAGPAEHMLPLRPIFEQFCRYVECDKDIALKPEKLRTYFLGADGLQHKNVLDRVILIGDAAGFVDPMMGEGIAYAMQSGVFAAKVIADAFASGRHDEKFLFNYQLLCDAEFGSSFGMAEWAGSQGSVLAEKVLPRINGHPLASEIMAQVARGEIGYGDLPITVLRLLPKLIPDILRRKIQSRFT